jgi:hypothetical protein
MSDAEAYGWADDDVRLDAFCLTAVTGVARDEVVRGFDGDLKTEASSTFVDAFNGYASPSYVLVEVVAGGVLAAENNGWQGVQHEIARRVSLGGALAAFYRSVNADMAFVHAIDGAVRASFDPLLEDVPPELSEQAAGLRFGDEVESSALALLERLTGVRVEQGWFDEPHSRFDVPSPY